MQGNEANIDPIKLSVQVRKLLLRLPLGSLEQTPTPQITTPRSSPE